MFLLEFVVLGIPISAQAKPGSNSKKRWIAKVAAAAQFASTAGMTPVSHNVHVQVVYYYTGAPLDADNMLKPILDAMNGIVYVDDEQVTDIRAAKRDLSESFRLEVASHALAKGLSGGTDFVHIRIENAPDPKDLL